MNNEWAAFDNGSGGCNHILRGVLCCVKCGDPNPTLSVSQKRVFDTGASRDSDTGKLDYEGFISPLVLESYAKYMHKNRTMGDGSVRASDNWTKGIPVDQYMKSLWRHFIDVHKSHRGLPIPVSREEALCAVLFNAMGMLYEHLKEDAAKSV